MSQGAGQISSPNFRRLGLRLRAGLAVFAFASSIWSSSVVAGTVTLHFPAGKPLGVVLTRARAAGTDVSWEEKGAAAGDVVLPDNCEIKIAVSNTNHEILCALAASGTGIDEISCAGLPIDDQALADLAPLRGVQRINLEGTQIKGPGLKHLAGLRSLQCLDLSDTPADDSAIQNLAGFEKLTELRLVRVRATGSGLAGLAQLKSLRRLDVRGIPLGESGFAALSKLNGVESLAISTRPDREKPGIPGDLALIAHLPNLKTLEVDGEFLDDAALEKISPMKNLKRLVLGPGNRLTDSGLAPLSKITSLESLTLTSGPGGISNKGLSPIGALRNLQSLELHCDGITDAGLNHLRKLENLHELNLKGTQVNDASLSGITAVHSRGDLSRWWERYGDSGLKNLKLLKQLRRLVIPQHVSLEGLRQLREALPNCSVVRR